MPLILKSLLKNLGTQEVHSGDLYVVVGTATYSTTSQTVTAPAGGLKNLKLGLASPFHNATHTANDVVGVRSDSLNTTTDVVTIARPASGTSGLVVAYMLIGDRITTS
ncbi:MAG: hypothetical protein QXU40_03560 [Candidatus Pacearchaeota archaeon]